MFKKKLSVEKFFFFLSFIESEYVSRIDSGDEWDVDKLKIQVGHLNAYKDVGLIGTQVRFVLENGNKVRESSFPTSYKVIRESCCNNIGLFSHSSIVFRFNSKIFYRSIYYYSQDLDLYLQFISNNIKIMEYTFAELKKKKIPFIFASSQMSNMTHSPYGILKSIGETYTRALKGLIVKFWNVYGVEHDPKKFHVITDFINMALTSKEIKMQTDGSEKRQFLHADDCSECLLKLSKIYNDIHRDKNLHITSYKWNSIYEVALIVSKIIGKEKEDEDYYTVKITGFNIYHFKEAEELVKGNLELFGRPDELKKLSIPSSGKLRKIHSSLIEASELLIQASNALEDNAWLGGSVSYAERNLEIARVNFQTAIKEIYALEDDKEIKPAMEPQEYEVGEKPERFDFKK